MKAYEEIIQNDRRASKPRDRPEQAAKGERKQTQALNGLGLRMFFLMSDFFRQDVNEPKNGDADDRRDDEHEPRDPISDGVESFAVE